VTREHKLGLILVFSVALAVAVVVSDHFSAAQTEPMTPAPTEPAADLTEADRTQSGPAMSLAQRPRQTPGSTGAQALPRVSETRGWGPPERGATTRARPDTAAGPAMADRSDPVSDLISGPGSAPRSNPGSGGPLVIDQGARDGSLASALQRSRDRGTRTDPDRVAQAEAGGGADDGGPVAGVQGMWSMGGRVMDSVRRLELPRMPAAELRSIGPQQPTPAPRSDAERRTRPEPRAAARPDRMRVVVEGDSLYSICAEEYGDGALWRRLAAYNEGRVADNGGVRAGVTLRLPERSVLTGAPTAGAPEADRPRAREQTPRERTGASVDPARRAQRTYIVQKGDMLGEIARRELGSSKRWREIVELNGLEDPDRIVVGMKLKLPAE